MTSTEKYAQDPVEQYASTVSTLHAKLDRVVSNQQEVANSLSRAAAALRSISARREQK